MASRHGLKQRNAILMHMGYANARSTYSGIGVSD